jgi:peroxiredoxin family protein
MGTFSAVLYSPSVDAAFEAASFLAAARARGDTPLLFLRGPALRAFLEKKWESPPATLGAESLFRFYDQTPHEFIVEMKSQGNFRVYACSAWVRLLGFDNAFAAARVDAVIGLNAFLSQAQGGPVLRF